MVEKPIGSCWIALSMVKPGCLEPATNRHFIEISRFSDTPVSIIIRSVFFPEFSDFFSWSISQKDFHVISVSQFSQNVSQNVLWDTTATKRQKFATNKTKIGADLRIVRDINFTRVLAAIIAFVGEGFAIFFWGTLWEPRMISQKFSCDLTNLTKRLTISQNVTQKSFCENTQNY